MTPHDLEVRLGDHPASAAVATVLDELRADPDWSVTEFLLDQHVVQVALVHAPTGAAYTLNRRRKSTLDGRRAHGARPGTAPAER